ncbi:GNAT family N-acetyltransferase [Aestuariimicrobium sp. p3-SID1156]|uniref:GNAT family N-acetyltransferase n=1 Tax=Aestuariimicrobium sp. p3-SID1156 TaxID=2916038 RepID=UPI00223AC983|nr:GNAT family N-acetyltransferase [Aestuariimicrobium sp. p3-SID1156]MCT1458728.1 GNAT family N-acetyltransferase [Aestuariimicrobium sp. p3-SID1156]
MITFREVRPTDMDAVSSLVNSAYRGDPSRAGWTTEADLLGGQRTDPATLTEELRTGTLVLVEDEGELVGCVRLDDGATHGHPDALYIGMVTVSPTRQGSGLGREILAESELRASRMGKAATIMTVISVREELIAWYARRGYSPTGEREAFPYGDERFGRPLRDDLEFVVLRKVL